MRALILVASVATAALLVAPVTAGTPPEVEASATCDDYSNQRTAQLRKDTRDQDGDGIDGEDLPCPCLKPGRGGGGGGRTCSRTSRTVVVELSR
jgi:hypothetical protein